jgi:glycosyltransferase involved in cell wall biosynthesis
MIDGAAPRVLVISHDVVGSRMAGPGIRAWHMARVLAAWCPVTLIAPRPIDLDPAGFRCGDYAWGDAASLAAWLRHAEIVVANGFMLEAHPELALFHGPLALDLYNPVLLENLELLRRAPSEQRADRAAQDQALLARQLAAGDFFLCATERQRDLYLGALMLAGRLTPALIDADPLARHLIRVVPFGLPEEPPVKREPSLRGVLEGIGADDPLLLWTGGLWDWLDPLTLIEAMPHIVERHPSARMVFLAGRHPGAAWEMRIPQLARARARALGLLGRHVFFYDEWVPYERRADFLLEATVAVSLHRDSLEMAYAAVRSRFLDHLWAGLPSVVSSGDAAAELVERHDLGLVVPPGDVEATAQALVEFLDDPSELRGCAERAKGLAERFTWERALEPLASFCRESQVTRLEVGQAQSMSREISTSKGGVIMQTEQQQIAQAALKDVIARLEQSWKVLPHELDSGVPLVGQAKRSANTLTRWYVAPIVEQQNAFNAAVVHAIQHLTELITSVSADIPALQDQISMLTLNIQGLTAGLERLTASLEQLSDIQTPLHHHIADIEQHLCDIDDAQTIMAERLAHPAVEVGQPS